MCPADVRSLIPREHVKFLKGCRDYFEKVRHFFVHSYYDPELPHGGGWLTALEIETGRIWQAGVAGVNWQEGRRTVGRLLRNKFGTSKEKWGKEPLGLRRSYTPCFRPFSAEESAEISAE